MRKEVNGKSFVPSWCTRGISMGIHSVLIMQVSYYATESAGLSIGLIGALILASKIFDGVTDLLAGYIIDNTRTRWGKARPYELFLIPVWLLTALLFSTPDMGTVGKAAWIFITYLLINAVCVTFLGASEAVFLSRATAEEGKRAKALTAAGIVSMFFPALIGTILPLMITAWGEQKGGWTKISLVIGIPAMLLGLFRFFFVKEMDMEDTKAEKISIKTSVSCLMKNKYIWLLGVSFMLCNLASYLSSVSQNYYFQYIVGDLSSMSVVGLFGLVTPLILLVFPFALKKIGGMNFIKLGLIVAIFGGVIKYFAGKNLVMILIGMVLSGIGTTILMMVGSIFVIQCMDYGEWKTGIRVEGMLNAVPNFATKIGAGISSGLAGAIMGLAGYVGGAEVQTASANTAIVWCYSLVPAIICILMLIILHFYDYEKKEAQIQKELEERRNNK